MDQQLTVYGERLHQQRPLPEHPRPQMVRESYTNLNGPWDYAIAKDPARPAKWDGKILVPFCPESALSGVGRTLLPGETLWYKRRFSLPEAGAGKRHLLHFGGVDQCCTVFVNGQEAGSHEGGYLPFTFDITSYTIEGEDNELSLCVTDPTETGPGQRGRQKLRHGGSFHTPMSGIWQTVWLESVPQNYIAALKLTPLYDEGAVQMEVQSGGGAPLQCEVTVLANTTVAAKGSFASGRPFVLPMPGAISWYPSRPFLYTVRVRAGEDEVTSYFGMRKFGMQPDADGTPRLMLNNKPLFLCGVLDQGFYPDGLYTPPSERAIIDDLRYAKACGFNMVRKYGKIEPLRWYYHCDKLGLVVWQDLPEGGADGTPRWSQPWVRDWLPVQDNAYRRFGREDASGRDAFRREMEEAAALLYNTVSLGGWVLFHAGQGQFDAAALAERMKQVDPTRLIDHASGFFDQGGGDIRSLYFEKAPPHLVAKKDPRAIAVTWVGDCGLLVPGHFCGKTPTARTLCRDEKAYERAMATLYKKRLAPMVQKGLCAVVLVQLADAQDEVSGLLTCDRRVQKIPPKQMAALNETLLGARP